jgi:hypothetical protein
VIIRTAKDLDVYKQAYALAISALDFARDCGYVTRKECEKLTALCAQVGGMPGSMIVKPLRFLIAER